MRKQCLNTLFAIAIISLHGFLPDLVWAQTYKADDIIKHFEPATPKTGVTRGICIGAEDKCGSGQVVKPPSAFDLVVKFKYNSDILEPDAKLNLDEFAKALKNPQLATSRFLVEGHTDASGTPGYNLELSERRAKAVVRYLSAQGVDGAKLAPRGYGQSKPVTDDPMSGDNRRVETRLRTE